MARYTPKELFYRTKEGHRADTSYQPPLHHYGQTESRSQVWRDTAYTGHTIHQGGSSRRKERETSLPNNLPRLELFNRPETSDEGLQGMLEDMEEEDRAFLELLEDDEETRADNEPSAEEANTAPQLKPNIEKKNLETDPSNNTQPTETAEAPSEMPQEPVEMLDDVDELIQTSSDFEPEFDPLSDDIEDEEPEEGYEH